MNRSGQLAAIVIMTLFTAVVFMAGWFVGGYVLPPERVSAAVTVDAGASQSAPRGALFDEAWGRVSENFVGTVPSTTLRDYGAIRGALSTLNDKYSYFIEPQTRSVERDHMRGQFGGIGVTFEINADGDVILTPRADGAAQKAGIKMGDRLVKIDGVALPKPAKAEDVVKLRGPVGTIVRVSVTRTDSSSSEIDFTITRELVQVASVEWKSVDYNGQTYGLIQIRQFTERTGQEVATALDELRAANARGYVLDLRDNGGGLLASAIDVVSEFVDKGDVLVERRRGKDEIVYAVRDDKADLAPLSVLINANSASASEVVAGALRDHKRAKLIGEKSFGKGSVQLIFDLSDGSSVHVTAAKWMTPNRDEIDGKGLQPDIEVKPINGQDAQLNRALQTLAEPAP
jgi:carboxyl-terminal processing protease